MTTRAPTVLIKFFLLKSPLGPSWSQAITSSPTLLLPEQKHPKDQLFCTTSYEHFWALPPCAQGQGCPYKPGQLCCRDHLSWKLFWIDLILHWFLIFNVKFTPRGLISILSVADQLVPCERQSRSRTWNRKHSQELKVIVSSCLLFVKRCMSCLCQAWI